MEQIDLNDRPLGGHKRNVGWEGKKDGGNVTRQGAHSLVLGAAAHSRNRSIDKPISTHQTSMLALRARHLSPRTITS